MRHIASRLSKLVSLSTGERRDLVGAQLALLQAQLAVWTRPHGRLVRRDPGPEGAAPDEQTLLRARRLASAVSLAARRGVFRSNCLVRSLALSRMLERERVAGWRVRIGVRGCTGQFEAHAWVELGREVLGDSSEHVAAFERFADVRLMEAQ